MAHKQPPVNMGRIFNSSAFTNVKLQPKSVVNNVTEIITEKFNGDMDGGSITDVKSIGKAIHTMDVDGQQYFSIKNHLDGTTLVQVRLTRGDDDLRVVCFVAASSPDGSIANSTLSDSSPSSSSNISLSSSGIITILATNANALISTLSIG